MRFGLMPTFRGFQVIKIYISDNACEYFDFRTAGKNMNRYRTAINRPQTERNRTGEEDVKISDCRVWTETAKGEEQISNKKKIYKKN